METNANAHLTTPTRLTGAEIVWATLVGEGVETVFGYPGGAILPSRSHDGVAVARSGSQGCRRAGGGTGGAGAQRP